MKTLDYRNSFAIYCSARKDRPDNTCRIQIQATCTLLDGTTDAGQSFYLGKECIGEYVYDNQRGIAQVPTSEVCIIFCHGPTALIKKFASHDNDVIQIADMGQDRRGFDGRQSRWLSMKYVIQEAEIEPLLKPQQIIAATLDGRSLVGRTSLDSDTGCSALLEYPIPYINVHPPVQGFQVDVGPILLADLASDTEPAVSRMNLAYVMFNDFKQVEFAIRVPTSIGQATGAETLHYAEVVKRKAQNELFAIV